MRNARAGFFSFHFLLCKHGRVNQLLAQIHSFNVPYNNCVLQSCAFFLQKHVLFFRDIQRLRPDIFVLVLHLLSACSQLLFFSTASQKHYSCITYTDGSLKIRNDFQFYSFRFFFSSSLFMWPERWILCYANHFSFFYSLSLSNSILRMLCLGCPVTSPVSAIFFTVSFFSFFFPAAIRSGDGRSGWNEKGKKCFGFFFFEEPWAWSWQHARLFPPILREVMFFFSSRPKQGWKTFGDRLMCVCLCCNGV